jgi:Holliday junction DNA helicase RuvA
MRTNAARKHYCARSREREQGAPLIGFLKGTLIGKRPPWLTLDVGGVGYELEAPMSTFYRLPEPGKPLSLVTHLVVREDAHLLYGFATEPERALFRSLIKVSNVGPKIALGILSGMSADGFYQCVRHKDVLSLTKIPGVGRKTADRLVLEMADRLPEGKEASGTALAARSSTESEAQGALLALGYKPSEVLKMLSNLDGAQLSTEEMIREALRRVHRVSER